MLAFLFIIATGCALVAGSPFNRVVGGIEAEPGQFPWQVQLRYTNGNHLCSGSIINQRWILTAAHCVRDVGINSFEVMTGSNIRSKPGDVYAVDKIVLHPQDDPYKKQNDLVLLRAAKEIVMGDNVKSIELGTAEDSDDVVLSGWGQTGKGQENPDELRFINIKVEKHSTCGLQWIWYYVITENQICTSSTGGRGACGGDSGGPLVKKQDDGSWKQVGILSFGQPCAVGWPDIHTYPINYIDWISKTISL